MAKVLMLQGTASDVGKSVLAAGLCRVLRREGVRVAPFKAQNMALNSYVTSSGGEMGRAQVVQAEACGLEPHVDMNPILLKPTTDRGAQVIVQGRVHGNMNAVEYHAFKKDLRRVVLESFHRLASRSDVVIVEGAGSPAEINLREGDIVNMGFALEVNCPVLLVGDIDKGGVFASLVGTLELIAAEERDLIKGFIINKFRGDASLLNPAFEVIEARTKKKFLGVVPYCKELFVQEEDGLHRGRSKGEERRRGGVAKSAPLRIVVLVANRISNFTDFDPFQGEPGVTLDFVRIGEKVGRADIIMLPGSKSTIADLRAFRSGGMLDQVLESHDRGATVVGICGGYQMLGRVVRDPEGTEGEPGGEAPGLGLLDAATVIRSRKVTAQVSMSVEGGALSWWDGSELLAGYEIHMGVTAVGEAASPLFKVRRLGSTEWHEDGAVSSDGRVIGTYIHGVFDNDSFRKAFLEHCAGEGRASDSFAERKQRGYDDLADLLQANLDMAAVRAIIDAGPEVAG